jgi:TerB-like protein
LNRIPLLKAATLDHLCAELDRERSVGIRLTLRVVLGRLAATGKPLGPELALRWIESTPGYYSRTPVLRCHEEFVRLFHFRYKQKYGDGFPLKATATKITIDYHPASASFLGSKVSATVLNGTAELTDVTVSEEPLRELRALAETCIDDLDGYSQFLGRNPDRRMAPQALALLPEELLREQESEGVAPLVSWLTQILDGKEIATIGFQQLQAKWPEIHREHYGKQDALSLVEGLGKVGFGMEPDVRFGSYAPSPDGKLVLFRLPPGAPSSPSPSMRAALLVLRLGAMVLAATELNGSHSEDLEQGSVRGFENEILGPKALLAGSLSDRFHLAAPERQRLRARLHWLLVSKPATFRNKKRIEALDLDQRRIIGHFLAGVTCGQGHGSPSGVNALERVYRLLGLEPKSLYSDLQSASTTPTTVEERASDRGGFAIPPPPRPGGYERGRIEIDMAKVNAMRAETQEVSDLLKSIFAEEDETPAVGNISPRPEGSILGLSSAHSAFLRILVSKTSWARTELEPLASAHHVLLNGAIDAINEKMLDCLGEPLLEGHERIEVNSSALKGLEL